MASIEGRDQGFGDIFQLFAFWEFFQFGLRG